MKKAEILENYRNALRSTLVSLSPVPEEELSRFLNETCLVRFKANEFFSREGEQCDRIGFIGSGAFRIFYTNDRNEQFTKSLIFENEFVASYSDLLAGKRATVSIQSLEKSDVLAMDSRTYFSFLHSHICWERIGRKIAETLHMRSEERERQFLMESAKTRYLSLLRQHPEVEGRIKQYHIASYLGINPVSLSRIRREMKLVRASG